MGTRQPARLKPIAYGLPEDAMSDGPATTTARCAAASTCCSRSSWRWPSRRSGTRTSALEQKPTADRSCEVIILASGSPSCVDPQSRAAHAAAAKRPTNADASRAGRQSPRAGLPTIPVVAFDGELRECLGLILGDARRSRSPTRSSSSGSGSQSGTSAWSRSRTRRCSIGPVTGSPRPRR